MQRHTGCHLDEPVRSKRDSAKSPKNDAADEKIEALQPCAMPCQAEDGTRN
jgi:hypothetical protein